MKSIHYLVRINRDPDSDWGASVPDLPGCVATARTLDTALRRIRKAIEFHLEGLLEDGVKPPRPRHRSVVPRSTSNEIDFYATVEVSARVA
jgi:predicted RNase H-like HicB family nuclease